MQFKQCRIWSHWSPPHLNMKGGNIFHFLKILNNNKQNNLGELTGLRSLCVYFYPPKVPVRSEDMSTKFHTRTHTHSLHCVSADRLGLKV